MLGVTVIAPDSLPLTDRYETSTVRARGAITSRRFQPEGYSLWAVEAFLHPAAELEWGTDHGDEALVVLDGALECVGRRCGVGAVIIVESKAAAVVAASAHSRVVHFGPAAVTIPNGHNGPPNPDGHGTHSILPDEAVILRSTSTIRSQYYADSTCPTCRVTLLRATTTVPYRSPSHSHSEDELMFVVAGDMQVGAENAVAGCVIAINGNRRYGFQSKTGCDFLNYRRDVSMYTRNPKDDASIETIEGMIAGGYVWVAST